MWPLKDKLKHFFISFILVILFFLVNRNLQLSVLLVIILGLVKELFDQRLKRNIVRESLKDLIFDLSGVALAVLAVYFIYY